MNKGIYCTDCFDGMEQIEDSSIDMVLCDLPYGQTARNQWDVVLPLQDLWKQITRITKENAAIVLFANGMFTADLMISNRKMWRYNLIWEKTQPTGFLNAKKMPLRAHEDICVFYKKPPVYNPQITSGHQRKVSTAKHGRNSKQSLDYRGYERVTYDSTDRYPRSVLVFPKDTQKESYHPTQKPVALCEWLIRTYSNPGDLVFDPTAGSMTTAVAAANTGREYICFEKDEGIFEIGKRRLERY